MCDTRVCCVVLKPGLETTDVVGGGSPVDVVGGSGDKATPGATVTLCLYDCVTVRLLRQLRASAAYAYACMCVCVGQGCVRVSREECGVRECVGVRSVETATRVS